LAASFATRGHGFKSRQLYLTLGLIAATLAWRPLRVGDRWAKVALWIFVTGLLAKSLVFFGAGDAVIGGTYLAATVASVGALTVSRRSPTETSET